MPDETIRINIEGDSSSAERAANATRDRVTMLREATEQYRTAVASLISITAEYANVLASINKQYGAGAANLEMFKGATTSFRDAIRQTASQVNTLDREINVLSASTKSSAQAAENLTRATIIESQAFVRGTQAAAAHATALTAVAEASSMVGGETAKMEWSTQKAFIAARALSSEAGLGGIGYALSRVYSLSPLLGPAMEAMLPVALAVGMAEAVQQLGGKIIELAHSMDPLYQAELRSLALGKELTKEAHLYYEELQRGIYAKEERDHGKTFSLKTQLDDAKATVKATDQYGIQQFDQQIKERQKKIAESSQEFNSFGGGKGSGANSGAERTRTAKALQVEIDDLEKKRSLLIDKMKIDINRVEELQGELTTTSSQDMVKHAQEQVDLMEIRGHANKAQEIKIWQGVADATREGGEITRQAYIEAMQKIITLRKQHAGGEYEAERRAAELKIAKLKITHTDTEENELAVWRQAAQGLRHGSAFYLETQRQIGDLIKRQDTEDARVRRENELSMITDLEHMDNEQAADHRKALQKEKIAVDEQFGNMETKQHISLQQTISYWEQMKSTYYFNSEIVKEAIEKIAAATEKLRRQNEQLEESRNRSQQSSIRAQYQVQSTLIDDPNSPSNAYSDTPRSGFKNQISTLFGSGSQQSRNDSETSKLHADEYRAELAAAKQQEQIYQQEPVKLQDIKNQELQIAQRYNQQVLQDSLKSIKDQSQLMGELFTTINQGISRSLTQWIVYGKGVGQVMRTMFADLVTQMAQYVVLQLAKEGEMWLMKKIFATQFQATDVAAQTAAASAKAGIQAASNTQAAVQQSVTSVAEVGSLAAVAGAAAAASTAAIPIIGPAMAPEAGLAMYAGIIGTFGPLAAFEHGGIIPNTGVALVHKDEHVTSAPLTKMLMNVAQGGGGGKQGSSLHVNQTNHINAAPDKHVLDIMKQNPKELAGIIIGVMRSMNKGFR